MAALTAGVPAHAQSSFASSTAATAGKVWSGAQDVAMYALGLIGVNYRFGGSTPDTGLDCSGLVRHVFEEVTGVSLPRTAKEMSALGSKVTPANLQPGDLVFFNTRRFAFSHVGIYLGDNRFVHAPSQGSEVRIAQLDQAYWQKHFNGARRVIGVLPALVPNMVSPAIANDFTPRALVAAPSPFALERADLTP
jgi:cell wall-associated NlpC family hydrolase